MAYIHKLNAAVEDGLVAPTRAIPYRLDSAAIHKTLLGLGIKLPENWKQIVAAGNVLDVRQIDAALDEAKISLSERLRFKHKLTEHGLLARGRPVVFSNKTPEMLDPWAAKFK